MQWNRWIKGTKILLDSFKLTKESIIRFSYRGNGWPGSFNVDCGYKKRSICHHLYLPIIRTYLQPSCLVCWDSTNEFSDISFGDAWKIVKENNIGTSLLIARTIEGNKLLQLLKLEDMIDVSDIEVSRILESQKANINFKKYMLEFRLSAFELLFGNRPSFYNILVYKDVGIKNILRTVLLFIRTYLSNYKCICKIIDPMIIYFLRRNIK